MIEYDCFYYLDVQKTASTYVQNVFKDVCGFAELKFDRHKPVEKKSFDKNKPTCLSIRDPITSYVSLYKHGLDGRGMLYKRMFNKNLGFLYEPSREGFVKWLTFVLDKNNSVFLGEGYAKNPLIAENSGFLTYRLIKLSVFNHQKFFCRFNRLEDLEEAYKRENIVDRVIKVESVDADIVGFVQFLGDKVGSNEYSNSDLSGLERLLLVNEKKNVSKSKIKNENNIYSDSYVKKLIMSREWVYKFFGYD